MIVTLVIALASIVVGELVPKTMALNFPERLALFVARPIAWLQVVVGPIVWFVSRLSTFLVRLLGGREKPQGGYLSTEELKLLVETGSEEGSIEEEEKEMIHGVIELGDKQVHEVMVPRIGIRAVNIQDPIDEVLDMVVRAGHSRVPVFEDNLDNIVGILYAKDLLPYLKASAGGNGAIDIREIVRQPVYVPESKPVDDLLHEMQAASGTWRSWSTSTAAPPGSSTMEDVVEEIVGEIQDEYDSEESSVEEISTDGELVFRLDGRVSMDDVRDLFDLSDDDEPDEEAYDTVGGFVVHRVGRIPLPGAEIPFRDEVRIRVEAAEPRRVSRVIASRPRAGRRAPGRRGADRDGVAPQVAIAQRTSVSDRACPRGGTAGPRHAAAPVPPVARLASAWSRAPLRSRIARTSLTSSSVSPPPRSRAAHRSCSRVAHRSREARTILRRAFWSAQTTGSVFFRLRMSRPRASPIPPISRTCP